MTLIQLPRVLPARKREKIPRGALLQLESRRVWRTRRSAGNPVTATARGLVVPAALHGDPREGPCPLNPLSGTPVPSVMESRRLWVRISGSTLSSWGGAVEVLLAGVPFSLKWQTRALT